MNIKKLIEDHPIHIKCPVCGEIFEGTFAATRLKEHFNDEHVEEDLNEYLPLEMEAMK